MKYANTIINTLKTITAALEMINVQLEEELNKPVKILSENEIFTIVNSGKAEFQISQHKEIKKLMIAVLCNDRINSRVALDIEILDKLSNKHYQHYTRYYDKTIGIFSVISAFELEQETIDLLKSMSEK